MSVDDGIRPRSWRYKSQALKFFISTVFSQESTSFARYRSIGRTRQPSKRSVAEIESGKILGAKASTLDITRMRKVAKNKKLQC